jgi:hypothetical protein
LTQAVACNEEQVNDENFGKVEKDNQKENTSTKACLFKNPKTNSGTHLGILAAVE